MSNISIKATKSGLKTAIKSLAGLPHRRQIDACWTWESSEVANYQSRRFREVYSIARREIPYYRYNPTKYPEMDDGISLLEFLQKLPLLPKTVVKAQNASFYRPRNTLSQMLRTSHTTSGTTGAVLIIPATADERGFTQAVLESWYLRICGRRWPRTLMITGFFVPSGKGSSNIWWHDPVSATVYLNMYSLNAENREAIIQMLQKFRPSLIYGYSSALAELAQLVGDSTALNANDPAAVVTSEVLHEHQRVLIQEKLASRVFNLYGSQEGAHIVLECPQRSWHIMPLAGIVEVVDDNGAPAAPGTVGQVAITSLAHTNLTLVRYLIGDMAMATVGESCTCNLQWPTIGIVEGRSEDVVRTRDGRRISLLGYNMIKSLPIRIQIGVREAQLIQRNYDRFECKLVLNSLTEVDRLKIEAGMKDELERRLGYRVEMSFVSMAEIPRGARGKFKAVVVEFDA